MPEESAAGGGAVSADAEDGERSSEVEVAMACGFVSFPLLSVGGGREEELQLEERSSRRGKREASEGECWASSRCRDRRREGSYEQERRMERASKKEEGKTEDRRNENGKKKRLPLPSLCASQLNLFFNFPPFPSSTFYSSPQVRKNRRRCPRDLLSAPGVPRGTAAEQSGGFRGEGGGRAAV